jgi:hypothetical protein
LALANFRDFAREVFMKSSAWVLVSIWGVDILAQLAFSKLMDRSKYINVR